MDRESKSTIVAIAVIAVLFVGVFGGIVLYSGHSPPFSTVTSQSMQHDDERSEIGVIDTGDMVLVKNKSKTHIVSYLEGRTTGFSKFGDYGSVIIYHRDGNQNPVIHRAIILAEITTDGVNKYLKANFLDEYRDADGNPLWTCTGSSNPERLKGTLTLNEMGYNKKTVTINLDSIISSEEVGTVGYITKGDNNSGVDQPYLSGLVTYEKIKSVPMVEIPWLGCIKLISDGRGAVVDEHAPNSIPAMGTAFLSFVLLLVSVYAVYFGILLERKYRREKE